MKENTPSYCSLLCPFHRFAVPLPRKRGRLFDYGILASPARAGERSTSTNHTSLTLVFLGRFPIRPVTRSAAPYGLASRTGQ